MKAGAGNQRALLDVEHRATNEPAGMVMWMRILGVAAVGLLAAACGTNTQQRAASGGLAGLGAGALVAGPVGAIVGAAAGAAGGWAMPEGADTMALNALGRDAASPGTEIMSGSSAPGK